MSEDGTTHYFTNRHLLLPDIPLIWRTDWCLQSDCIFSKDILNFSKNIHLIIAGILLQFKDKGGIDVNVVLSLVIEHVICWLSMCLFVFALSHDIPIQNIIHNSQRMPSGWVIVDLSLIRNDGLNGFASGDVFWEWEDRVSPNCNPIDQYWIAFFCAAGYPKAIRCDKRWILERKRALKVDYIRILIILEWNTESNSISSHVPVVLLILNIW